MKEEGCHGAGTQPRFCAGMLALRSRAALANPRLRAGLLSRFDEGEGLIVVLSNNWGF